MWDEIIAAIGHLLVANSAVDQAFLSKEELNGPIRSKVRKREGKEEGGEKKGGKRFICGVKY